MRKLSVKELFEMKQHAPTLSYQQLKDVWDEYEQQLEAARQTIPKPEDKLKTALKAATIKLVCWLFK